MTRKRRKTRSRQERRAVNARGVIGMWQSWCRWYLFSEEQNMRALTGGGHGRNQLARRLQETKRCPVCHSAPMQCPHITLDVFQELQERLLPVSKQRPWPFQHAGRWP